ncbi:MAG TPA: hypothetical protein VFH61_15905 [Thermoleophilia bacterium]|nr:hypothetical protein [Thermoleophilia bacterium]
MARPHRGIFFWFAASLGACAGCICDPLVVLSVCLTLFTACVLVDVFCALAPDEKELWPPRSGGKPAPGKKPHVDVRGTDRFSPTDEDGLPVPLPPGWTREGTPQTETTYRYRRELAPDEYDALRAVLEAQRAVQPDRPLVTLGQGDYEIHIRPSDLTDAEREALR